MTHLQSTTHMKKNYWTTAHVCKVLSWLIDCVFQCWLDPTKDIKRQIRSKSSYIYSFVCHSHECSGDDDDEEGACCSVDDGVIINMMMNLVNIMMNDCGDEAVMEM